MTGMSIARLECQGGLGDWNEYRLTGVPGRTR